MTADLSVAARGVGWNYAGSGATLAAQVLYTAFTARLVSPAGFGAYASAQALVAFVGVFGLATVGNAVIRHEREGPVIAGTGFVISIAAGAVASAAVFLCAGPWATLWDVPASEALVQLLAIVVLVQSLSYVPLALLRKALDYRRAALIEAAAQIAGMCVGVAAVLELRSPTGLVVGQAAAAALLAVAAIAAARGDLALAFSRREARSLLRFSSQVSGQSLVYYALYTAPAVVISRLFGASALGWYSRGSLLVMLPVTHLWLGVTRTLYPLVARARDDTARLRVLIESAVLTSAGLTWPILAAVAGAAPIVVPALLGPGWSEVESLLPPILLFGALNLVYVVAGNPLEVLAFQRLIWRFQLLWICLLAAALSVGAAAGLSLEELLWSVAAVQLVIHLLKLRATARIGLLRFDRVLRGYCSSLALAVPFYLVTAGVERATSGSLSLVEQVVAELLAVLMLLLLTSLVFPSTPLTRAVRGGARLVDRQLRAARAAHVDRARRPQAEL